MRSNAEIAQVLSTLATMLEIEGANPFRVRAYREGARVVEASGEPMAALADAEGALEALPGIGKDLAQKIRDLARTGSTELYDDLRKKIPLEVVGFTELQGLGPKRVKTLFETLGIRDRAALAQAATEGRLRDLPGFGEKVEQNVLKALEVASHEAGRLLLANAWGVAHALAERVARVPGVSRVELAGSFRRRRETVGDLDLLVCGGRAEDVMEVFTGHPDVADVLGRGDTKSSVRLRNGLQVDLRLVPAESFGAALLYFTGSKAHNIELRRLAIDQGLSLNEYGLTRERDGHVVAARTEEDVYGALGLAWIPPESREAWGEIALAREGRLPRLIEERDLVADLHVHSDRSDGRDPLEAMVRAARDRGYAYCAITEHSQSLAMARGFDTARVRKSVAEIAAVRQAVPGIRVLHGLEVDILAAGALDLDDEGLALLDWVIVSLHSRLDQPAEVATARVLRGARPPAGVRDGTSDRAPHRHAPRFAVRRRARVRARRRTRRGDGDQRPARPARPHRRARAAGEGQGGALRDRHRRALHRAAREPPLRRVPGPPRRAHGGRRAQHAPVRAFRRVARASARGRDTRAAGDHGRGASRPQASNRRQTARAQGDRR